jgi:hypothetical protein
VAAVVAIDEVRGIWRIFVVEATSLGGMFLFVRFLYNFPGKRWTLSCDSLLNQEFLTKDSFSPMNPLYVFLFGSKVGYGRSNPKLATVDPCMHLHRRAKRLRDQPTSPY